MCGCLRMLSARYSSCSGVQSANAAASPAKFEGLLLAASFSSVSISSSWTYSLHKSINPSLSMTAALFLANSSPSGFGRKDFLRNRSALSCFNESLLNILSKSIYYVLHPRYSCIIYINQNWIIIMMCVCVWWRVCLFKNTYTTTAMVKQKRLLKRRQLFWLE
jgi:hypothetical protein